MKSPDQGPLLLKILIPSSHRGKMQTLTGLQSYSEDLADLSRLISLRFPCLLHVPKYWTLVPQSHHSLLLL